MANSADPDQLASSEANWSGSTLFAMAGHIRVQQDKGLIGFRPVHDKTYNKTSVTSRNSDQPVHTPSICLCWGFTAQSTQWGHVERGQFT